MPDLQSPNVAEAEQTDIEKALFKQLASMGEVAELVARTPTGPAISPINASQGEVLPRITYQLIDDEPVGHLKGETGAKVATFHLKCWASDPAGAKALAKAIRGSRVNPRLAGFRSEQHGLFGGLIYAAFVKVTDHAGEVEVPVQADEPAEYWYMLIVVVQYYDPIKSQ